MRIWDLSGRIAPKVLKLNDRVHAVDFSPDGKFIATTGDDKTLRVWDVASFVELESNRRLHRAGIWSVAFSHDGGRLATACWSPSGWVRTWPVAGR